MKGDCLALCDCGGGLQPTGHRERPPKPQGINTQWRPGENAPPPVGVGGGRAKVAAYAASAQAAHFSTDLLRGERNGGEEVPIVCRLTVCRLISSSAITTLLLLQG